MAPAASVGGLTVRLIDADAVLRHKRKMSGADFGGEFWDEAVLASDIKNAPTVDAVPVSELEKLRDYLYAEDLIFMRGLAKLNKLIAKHGGTKAGKTPDKNTKP